MSKTVLHENSFLSAYPVGIAFSGKRGVHGDGLVLSLIGVAVSLPVGPFHLAAVWLGLLGASSLAGPFSRRMFAAPIASNCCPRTIRVAGDRQDTRFATAVAGSSKSRFRLADRTAFWTLERRSARI